ncbi:hypothetical protein KDN32_00310 [Nocardioides sp. J2M5]|uniref:hypothetical protein n=1 Tax=Nocardioides palaemonis TaxID=2829810 RepID=UPI001BA7DF2D|nr:hypothetical protein [Nocardioides palaemonis]MBS2936181.1 hypothetical protein [Nocardioides palaemonis]
MAKRLFLLHIGPDAVDVRAIAGTLALGGVVLPDVSPATLHHAGLELTRTHKAAGLKRKQVEGAWAKVCRRAWKSRTDCFVSVPELFAATPEQAALALDGLAGMRVVLVVTSGFTATPPEAWTAQVDAARTHVLPARLTDEQLAAQVARIALIEEKARLDKRLARVGRRRKQVTRRLAA